jgi:hypothetical protein
MVRLGMVRVYEFLSIYFIDLDEIKDMIKPQM